jgi:hypothetical protein
VSEPQPPPPHPPTALGWPSAKHRQAWVRKKTEELRYENRSLGLPYDGGFIQSLLELEAESYRQSVLARRRSDFFKRLYYLFGLPAAILAAIAGATALASTTGRIAVGVIALTSAALSAAVVFLDADKQRERSSALQKYWDDLYNEIHVARLTQLMKYTETSGPWALSQFYRKESNIRAGRDPSTGVDLDKPASNDPDTEQLLFP